MVRRKIEIKRIEEDARRYTTFSKRRDGLFKKTMDFCNKFEFIGAAIAITKFGNIYAKAHPHINTVVSRYYAAVSSGPQEENHDDDVVQVSKETMETVSVGMYKKMIVSALKNVDYQELDGLHKVFESVLEDTRALKRKAELNVQEIGHAA